MHDIQEIANYVMEEFGFQHLVMFDKYNLYEIVRQSKLSKFSVGMLREICINLHGTRYIFNNQQE